MVKIEEWTENEIKEACSFSCLINRLYSETHSDPKKMRFSFEHSVKNIDDFEHWSNEFRSNLAKILQIDDLLKNRNPKKR
jgi:hypothetical protein